MDKKTIELAVALHGHMAPGIALGLRMSELALLRLNMRRGDKHLIGISETARCLADAMQATTGCTLGHGNACVEDYGKLAITIGDARTKKGVRVALKENANSYSSLMNKWMMRLGKLTHEEEEELGIQLLSLDEKYLLIQDVEINKTQNFDNSAIARCSECGELIPRSLSVMKDNEVYCKTCGYGAYYKLLKIQKQILKSK
jgi:formylmethanofuran dehydrogenase subunit E